MTARFQPATTAEQPHWTCDTTERQKCCPWVDSEHGVRETILPPRLSGRMPVSCYVPPSSLRAPGSSGSEIQTRIIRGAWVEIPRACSHLMGQGRARSDNLFSIPALYGLSLDPYLSGHGGGHTGGLFSTITPPLPPCAPCRTLRHTQTPCRRRTTPP